MGGGKQCQIDRYEYILRDGKKDATYRVATGKQT